jgi:hypothetical protein
MPAMMRMRRVVLAVSLTLVVGGCSATHAVNVSANAGSATVSIGDTLNVDFGDTNQSIGDSWYLVGKPDPAVLIEKDRSFDSDCAQPGCGSRLTWVFNATGIGATTVVFRYCYRSRPESCQPGPGRGPANPVSLMVTVR